MQATAKGRKRHKASNVQRRVTSAGVRFRAHLMIDGRRVYGTGRMTIEEAEADVIDMRKRADESAEEVELLTFKGATKMLLEHTAAKLRSEGTSRFYSDHVAVLLAAFKPDLPLHAIRPADVEKFIALRLKRDKVTAATVRHDLATLRRIFSLALAKKHLPAGHRSPVAQVEMPAAGKPRLDFYTMDELRSLTSIMRASGLPHADRDADIVWLLALSGLRLGELARLQVRDIDAKAGLIHVRGKTARREVQMGADLRAIAARWVVGRKRDAPLVPLGKDEPARARSIQRIFCRWAGKEDLRTRKGKPRPAAEQRLPKELAERLRPHVLRHTYATSLLRAGARAHDVQALIGHRTPMMLARYTHAVGADLRRTADLLSIQPKGEPAKAEAAS